MYIWSIITEHGYVKPGAEDDSTEKLLQKF